VSGMKTAISLLILPFLLSSCAPGAFTRSSGVPVSVGETWVLEMKNTLSNTTSNLEIRVTNSSQPASRRGTGAYLVGPYAITFNVNVTDVQWFEQYSNARYLVFYSYRVNDQNRFVIDIDRSFSERSSSCDFRGWKYGDSEFVGRFSTLFESQGSVTPSAVGECTLTRKP
jgi:hypothetical protein